jgi:hypothetical protein
VDHDKVGNVVNSIVEAGGFPCTVCTLAKAGLSDDILGTLASLVGVGLVEEVNEVSVHNRDHLLLSRVAIPMPLPCYV